MSDQPNWSLLKDQNSIDRVIFSPENNFCFGEKFIVLGVLDCVTHQIDARDQRQFVYDNNEKCALRELWQRFNSLIFKELNNVLALPEYKALVSADKHKSAAHVFLSAFEILRPASKTFLLVKYKNDNKQDFKEFKNLSVDDAKYIAMHTSSVLKLFDVKKSSNLLGVTATLSHSMTHKEKQFYDAKFFASSNHTQDLSTNISRSNYIHDVYKRFKMLKHTRYTLTDTLGLSKLNNLFKASLLYSNNLSAEEVVLYQKNINDTLDSALKALKTDLDRLLLGFESSKSI